MLSWIKVRILVVLYDNKGWLTTDQLTRRLSSNKRTIQYELTQLLNDYPMDIELESNRKYGYRLISMSQDVRDQIIKVIEEKEMNYSMPERASLILLNLLFSKTNTSIPKIANDVFLSTTSVHNEMGAIKRWVAKLDGFEIEIGNQGIMLKGDEYYRRVACSIFGTWDSLDVIVEKDVLQSTYSLIEIQDAVKKALVSYGLKLAGQEFTLLTKFIYYGLLRDTMGFEKEVLSELDQGDDYQSLAATIYENLLVKAPELEIAYLTHYLHGNVNLAFDESYQRDIRNTIIRFEEDLKEMFQVDSPIVSSQDTMEKHILNMMNRVNNDKRSVNYMDKRIVQTFPYASHLAELYCERYLGITMPKAEVLFLALYMSQTVQRIQSYLNVLIVSNQTASVVNSLIDKLQSMIGKEANITFIPEYMFDKSSYENHDLVLTTEPPLIFKSDTIKLIPPILDNDNTGEVESYLKFIIDTAHETAKQRIRDHYVHDKHVTSIDAIIEDINASDTFYSENVTDSKTLLIMRQASHYTNTLNHYVLKTGVEYKKRTINTVIVASANFDRPHVFAMFDILSDILQKNIDF